MKKPHESSHPDHAERSARSDELADIQELVRDTVSKLPHHYEGSGEYRPSNLSIGDIVEMTLGVKRLRDDDVVNELEGGDRS